jgi:hypothetical protein
LSENGTNDFLVSPELREELSKHNVMPIAPGELHLQNSIRLYRCYICNHDTDDCVLLRLSDKEMGFACTSHPNIVIEFIRQYKRPPLGWTLYRQGDQNLLGHEVGSTED